MADALEAVVSRYIAAYGPITAADIVDRLGANPERVGEAMARLLDAHEIVVAFVTLDGEPLYAVAAAWDGPRGGCAIPCRP